MDLSATGISSRIQQTDEFMQYFYQKYKKIQH